MRKAVVLNPLKIQQLFSPLWALRVHFLFRHVLALKPVATSPNNHLLGLAT